MSKNSDTSQHSQQFEIREQEIRFPPYKSIFVTEECRRN